MRAALGALSVVSVATVGIVYYIHAQQNDERKVRVVWSHRFTAVSQRSPLRGFELES